MAARLAQDRISRKREKEMLGIGIAVIVVAVILAIFGFVGTAVTWLLYLGIALLVVGLVLIFLDRRGRTSTRL
jgi:purine-cytosine permease-like protein